MTDKMPITPEVLVWARLRSGRSLPEITNKFPKIKDWERGEDQPSYSALGRLSDLYKIPIAVFFLSTPPAEPPLKQSFRTIPEFELEHLPVTLRKILREAQAMQINLNELNDGINPAEKRIFADLRFDPNTSISLITRKVRNYISVSVDDQSRWSNQREAFEKWRDIFINNGIYVFKDAFETDDFSGFCLFDNQFSVIYVNNSTTPTRQIFTLFHELAHLLFKTSGIDKKEDNYISVLHGKEKKIEVICNQFSAAFLVPDEDFERNIKQFVISDENIALLANRYKVSRAVILGKLLSRNLVSEHFYKKKVEEWDKQVNKVRKGGGNYYYTQMSYLGKRYINLAFTKFHQQKINQLQLADYLNVKSKNVGKFEEAFLGGRL